MKLKKLDGTVICEGDTLKSAVESALKQGANLQGANLWGANLQGADLRGANLQGANLQGADLWGANLRGANLWGANLQGADLRGANLQGANLRGANLQGANLQGADLWGANLQGADLWGAKDLSGSIAASLLMCPEYGEFTGWKKCQNSIIVKLLIPADAKRSSATGRKCRAEFATVLEVIGASEGISQHDNKTVYRTGETVRCDKWEEDRWIECGGGIHFFITRAEAENY